MAVVNSLSWPALIFTVVSSDCTVLPTLLTLVQCNLSTLLWTYGMLILVGLNSSLAVSVHLRSFFVLLLPCPPRYLFLDACCVESRNRLHIMLHPLWRVSYIIYTQRPGAKLSLNSNFINSSGIWCQLVSKPVIFIVSDSDDSNIILKSSVSLDPYRSNHICSIWYSWTKLW